jgi:hypothetical protein
MPLHITQTDVFQMLTEHQRNLAGTQMDMVRAAPEEQRPFLEAQFKLENEAQAAEMVGKILKSDDTAAVIRNLG